MKMIDPRFIAVLLGYLDTKPHGEVRGYIDGLMNLPDYSPPKEEEPKPKEPLKVVT